MAILCRPQCAELYSGYRRPRSFLYDQYQDHWCMYLETSIAFILTHWGQVTHICVSKLTTIWSDNGLAPDQCQAIIWTNAGILLIGPLGPNHSEIFIETHIFSLKMNLKISSAKVVAIWSRPQCVNVVIDFLYSLDQYLLPSLLSMDTVLLIHVLVHLFLENIYRICLYFISFLDTELAQQ